VATVNVFDEYGLLMCTAVCLLKTIKTYSAINQLLPVLIV